MAVQSEDATPRTETNQAACQSDQLRILVRRQTQISVDIFLNKSSQALPILIIPSVLENCKEFESTFMSNPCENHSVHEGRSTLRNRNP